MSTREVLFLVAGFSVGGVAWLFGYQLGLFTYNAVAKFVRNLPGLRGALIGSAVYVVGMTGGLYLMALWLGKPSLPVSAFWPLLLAPAVMLVWVVYGSLRQPSENSRSLADT
jgi:hypothetical protein